MSKLSNTPMPELERQSRLLAVELQKAATLIQIAINEGLPEGMAVLEHALTVNRAVNNFIDWYEGE